MDSSSKKNQAEEIIYLNYKIRRNTAPQTNKQTNKQTTPDYSWATVIIVIFWTERISALFWLYEFIQQQTWKLMNKQKISLIKQIHSLHLENPLKKNVKRLVVCVPFRDLYSQPSQISKMERSAKIVNG